MDTHATPSGTAEVSWGSDRIDLFTVDGGAGLVHRVFMSGTWSEPESLGGSLASAPATAWGVDQLQVFAIRRRPAVEPLLGRRLVARMGVAGRLAHRHAGRVVMGR